MLRIDGSRLWRSLMELAQIGATPEGGVARVALSEEDRQARDLLRKWAEPLVDEVHVDEVGNLFFLRHGLDPEAPMVLTGSHLDTQIHGGRFDGAFGVMAGLEVLQTLADAKRRLSCGVGLVCWTNEEEARYCPAMGSAVFVGKQDPETAWACIGTDGSVFGEQLEHIGYRGSRWPLRIHSYLEAHIEQGPVLEQEGLEVGVVTGAQGQVALDVEIHGEAGHSGTVPMPLRHDAMACATEATQACRHLVLQEGRGVFTVGFFTMEPNSRTTIPNQVRLGIDLRHPDSSSLDQLKAELTCTLQEIAQTHGCQLEVRVLFQKEPVVFDTRCIQAVQIATDQLQYSSRTMASGAFHDACLVATIAPTGMIFVPSQHGISHNPTEYSSPEQLERGGNVLLHALLQLAESIPNTS